MHLIREFSAGDVTVLETHGMIFSTIFKKHEKKMSFNNKCDIYIWAVGPMDHLLTFCPVVNQKHGNL